MTKRQVSFSKSRKLELLNEVDLIFYIIDDSKAPLGSDWDIELQIIKANSERLKELIQSIAINKRDITHETTDN